MPVDLLLSLFVWGIGSYTIGSNLGEPGGERWRYMPGERGIRTCLLPVVLRNRSTKELVNNQERLTAKEAITVSVEEHHG